MTKKEYIQQRKSNNYSYLLFYEYYQENNIKKEFNFNLQQFQDYFSQFMSIFGQEGIIQKVIDYYDKKFEIQIIEVEDKQGRKSLIINENTKI